ncbi:hypothetical protein [Pasteurella sp. PK-2025]|uniref:hypothetical protein n=1 Tax=Pasteurella sp. PK-2025 TaxID=3413133 RepID=UPI003C73CF3A
MDKEVAEARDRALASGRKELHVSKYPVERFFDRMPLDERKIIFALAKVELTDRVNPNCPPLYLRDFTEDGQTKIAKAYRKIREMATRLPPSIRESDFKLIDKGVNYANRKY